MYFWSHLKEDIQKILIITSIVFMKITNQDGGEAKINGYLGAVFLLQI